VVSQRLLPRADGKGRLAAFEVMVASSAIRTLIREAKMHQALGVMQASRAAGMVTMEQSLEELLKRGTIDKEEALRYMQSAGNPEKSRPKPVAASNLPNLVDKVDKVDPAEQASRAPGARSKP
ncbi:MAG TPA: hypothetical protein VHM19_15755, partial [Polyangiales bacterium]|nr:hypothetical protein [Polyangiales bacterium]